MNDATSILDLPTDPVGGGTISNNIRITAQEVSKSPNTDSIKEQQINFNIYRYWCF